jgi:MoxR-like ATPase
MLEIDRIDAAGAWPPETALRPLWERVRASSLVLAAKARALIHGRYAATREDVTALAAPVLRHRPLLSFAAEAEQRSADDVVAALLRGVPYPA